MKKLNKNSATWYDESMGHDLISAAEGNKIAELEIAIEATSDINYQEQPTGITALHAACANGCIEAVERLLQVGSIDLDVVDSFGRTAIDIAMRLHYDEIINLLADHQVQSIERRGHINIAPTPNDPA